MVKFKTIELTNGKKLKIEKRLTVDGKQVEIKKFYNREGRLHRQLGAAVIVFQDGVLVLEKYYRNGKERPIKGGIISRIKLMREKNELYAKFRKTNRHRNSF